MSDLHLGAHREPALRRLEMAVFHEAMDRCISGRVDFILISGDLFHVGIPDLEVVNGVAKKMREVQREGIPIYAIYGSHDYNPSSTSIIDIIETVGLLTNISKWKRSSSGRIELAVFEDGATGAKLCGISARKMGLEAKHYEQLDKSLLEKLAGFKVFAFHSGITELKPEYLNEMETIPISYLPSGFDYYAGGHIHQRGEYSLPGYDRVIFPGPLFTGYGKDIETTARGEPRGFYEVEFDEKVRNVAFVPMTSFGGAYMEVDASGMNSTEAWSKIQEKADELEVVDRVVAIKVKGELSGGKTSDINFGELRGKLMERGALFVYLNRHGLSSKEYTSFKGWAEDPVVIEARTLEQGIANVNVSAESLRGSNGVQTAKKLLSTLRQASKEDESKKAYSERILRDSESILGLSREPASS